MSLLVFGSEGHGTERTGGMIIRQKKHGGRPSDKVMDALTDRYGLSPKKRAMATGMVAQLSLCGSEEARRVLLGVSEKFAAGERAA